MTSDKSKGITSIEYNYLNLPTKVEFGSSNNRIEWTYTVSGVKLEKRVYTSGNLTLTQNYVSRFVYKNGILDFFSTETGRIKRKSNGILRYEYTLADHLGNARVTFTDDDANGSAETLEYSAYYAFGMRIEGLSTSNPDNKFTFNGEELENDLGLNWYHYGARYYDPQLGRWHAVDLVDEFKSPYLFCANNPIRNHDPNGMWNDDVVRIGYALVAQDKKYGDAKLWSQDKTTWHDSPQLTCNQFIYTTFRLAGFLPTDKNFEPSRADIGTHFAKNYSVLFESSIDWKALEPGDIVHYGSYKGNYGGHILMVASAAMRRDNGETYYKILHAKDPESGVVEEEISVAQLQKRMEGKGNQNIFVARGPEQMDVPQVSDNVNLERRDNTPTAVPINISVTTEEIK